jgi:hypothetical protein
MDLDPVDVFELCLVVLVVVLVLNADSTVIIILTPEVDVVCFFNPQIVASCQGVKHSGFTVVVCDWSSTFHTKVEDIDSIFAEYQEILVLSEEEPFHRTLV